jgi:hypothetical protein
MRTNLLNQEIRLRPKPLRTGFPSARVVFVKAEQRISSNHDEMVLMQWEPFGLVPVIERKFVF